MRIDPPDWRPIRLAVVGDDAGRRAVERALSDAAEVDAVPMAPAAVLERLDGRSVRIDPPQDRVDCVVWAGGQAVDAGGDAGGDAGDDPGGDAATDAAAGASSAASDDAAADGVGSFVADVRDRDPDVPVLVHPTTGSVDEATAVTAAGATRYLPRETDAGADGLVAAVRETVETYDGVREDLLVRGMFHTVLEDLQLSIFFKNEDGEHVCASSMAASSRTEPVVGKTDVDLYADEIGEAAYEAYRDDLRVARTGEPIVEKEERHVSDRGEVNWLRTTKLPWEDDEGTPRGVVGITEVIDELKSREAALERERRRLEGFASFASHDLRNPIGVARGYLELARETGDASALDEVEVSIERMDDLIDDVLALVQPGNVDESFVWVDLRAAVEDAWERVDAPEATCAVAVPADLELRAAAGPLGQLLENLLQNAIDHAGPAVAVEVGVTDTGFYVVDDGQGVGADEPERVFEYGYTDGGTGLGLAIAREVADLHGWNPGVGRGCDARFHGARFDFENCIFRSAPHRRAVEGSVVQLTESVDVGSPEQAGESGPLSGDAGATGTAGDVDGVGPDAWVVRGGGKNLWRDVEEYHLRYAHAPADVRIVARLADLDHAHEYTKAGVVVARWPTGGEPTSFLGSVGAHGCETIHRPGPEDDLRIRKHTEWTDVPVWLRLDRVGRRVTCYLSEDGEAWTPVDQHVLDLDGSVVAGLAVCSHNPQRRSTAAFDHLRITPLTRQD